MTIESVRKPITNPNVNNEDPKYWEEVLESHDLSLSRGGEGEDEDGDIEFVDIDSIEISSEDNPPFDEDGDL